MMVKIILSFFCFCFLKLPLSVFSIQFPASGFAKDKARDQQSAGEVKLNIQQLKSQTLRSVKRLKRG